MRALLAIALLCGCASPLGTSSSAIFGGEVTNQHPEVGWIAYDEGFVCSAVLVTPTRAVTAAHCVYPFENDPSVLSVVFGTDPRPALVEGIGVASQYLAPDFTTTPSHDIAVLELAAEANVGPVPYRTLPLTDDDLDAELTLVGYGLSNVADPEDDRPRRQATVVLGEVDSLSVRWFSETSGLCYGDSGGGVFLNGELVAVATEGDADCATRGAGVRTDVFADFVTEPAGDDDDSWGDDDDAFGDEDDVAPQPSCASASFLPLLLLPLPLRRRRTGLILRGPIDPAGSEGH